MRQEPGDGAEGATASRRRVLLGAGAALAGLAGCNAGGTDIVDSTETFGHVFPYDPESVNLNPWPGASYPYDFQTMMFESKSVLVPGEGRVLTDLVEAVEIEGSTATVTFDDAYTWWNGEPVTARDQWVGDRIQAAVSDESRPEVAVVDEYTLEYEFETPLARPIALSRVASGALDTSERVFGRWVERLDAAGTAETRGDVVDDLQDWRYSLEDASDEGFGNGPYELVEASINRLMLELYEGHPAADDIDVPQLWFPVVQRISRDKLIAEGQLDGGQGLLTALRERPPDYIEQFDTFQTTSGVKLALDWRHPHVGRRPVRRAMLAALPLDQVADVGGFGDPKPVQTGLSEPAERRWLPEGVLEDFETYPVSADRERGASLMRDAGYRRRDDGTWVSEAGDTASLRFRTPMWDSWKAVGDLVGESLSEFGFDVDFLQVSNTRLFSDVRTHNFDAMLWLSDARPYATYDVTSALSSTLGYGTSDPEAETSEQGKPVEPTLPDGRTVNLVEEWERLRRPSDTATAVDAITTFARWWNHALPDIQLATRTTGVWGNTRDFTWPDAEGTTYRELGPNDRPEYRLLKRGLIRSAD